MFKLLAKPLSKSEQEQLIAQTLAWILRVSQPLRLILFGSAARLEMTDCSDIDLILIFSDQTHKDVSRSSIYKTRSAVDWPLDLLFYTEAEFLASAAKGGGAAYVAQSEGRVLFPKESHNEPT